MERGGVVHSRFNSARFEVRCQLIPFRPVAAPNDIQVKCRYLAFVSLNWHNQRRLDERLAVAPSKSSSSLVPAHQMWQFHVENCSVQFIETIVVSHFRVCVLLSAAVVCQSAHSISDRRALRGDNSCVAKCT